MDDLTVGDADRQINEAITRVYLVRHGLTEWNASGRYQGHIDVPLSVEGRAQAEAIATRLAAEQHSFAAIYTSDLSRAADTAAAIGARLGLVPVPTEALREIMLGDWDGLTHSELQQRYPEAYRTWMEMPSQHTMPNGESFMQVQERMITFFRHIIEAHKGENIILVSHGAALSSLIIHLLGWETDESWRSGRTRIGNTALTIFELSESGKPTCTLLNCTAHLEMNEGVA